MNLALLLNLQEARKRGDADRVNNNNNNVAPTLQFSLTALLNLRSLASKRPASSSSDLNCGPSLAKRIKTDEDRKKSTHSPSQTGPSIDLTMSKHSTSNAYTVPYPNLKKYLSNKNSLYCKRKWAYNISKFYKGKNIQLLQPADVADVFDIVVSKSDEVPTRELSSHIKTELYPHQKLRDNSRKFYRLVIISEDTHYKQTIKKAYIMLLERASLILFIT
ncbi:hypothetical protein HBI23_119740 [Parastagonospora nodorum]|nr:hypothetical protein HBI23_119740 [Parastagonospora nodorum]